MNNFDLTWIDNCKSRRWECLETEIEYPCVHIDFKILARATFDAYHPEKKYQLNAFTPRLLETNFKSSSPDYGLVHLGDFASAYLLAVDEVKDILIAAKICDFVKRNAGTLGLMLASKAVDPLLKTRCIVCFPFMAKYRQDLLGSLTTSQDDDSLSELSSSSEPKIDPAFLELPSFKETAVYHFPAIPAPSDEKEALEASSDSSTVEIPGLDESDAE